MKAIVIHHLRSGLPDLATEALAAAGYTLDHRYPIEGDALPRPEDGHAVALVHGSLADVTQHDAPGIAEEMRWIEAWWDTGRPYFGICHGLQLAAQLLGASVGPPAHGKAEFGYYPLVSRDPARVPDGLHAFQWHYYGAGLPDGARCLASSDLYANQVVEFGPGRFGLQGHLEMPLAMQTWLQRQDPDGPTRPGAQSVADQQRLVARHADPMHAWFRGFFGDWLERAAPRGMAMPKCS